MRYQMNFGRLAVASSRPAVQRGQAFRLALLGDFSARSNRGELQTGAELAKRRPLRVDVDNIETILQRLAVKLRFPLTEGGEAVEIELNSIEDFHPDELYDKLEVFGELSALRRQLQNSSTFASAAKTVQGWLPSEPAARPVKSPARSGATMMPRGKLSDFARLVGGDAGASAGSSAGELIQQVVAPHIVPAADPQQAKFVAGVDAALSTTMRHLLHHPDFQAAESLWRSVDLLTRRLETGAQLQIILYDITAEEIAADLSRTDDLTETGLYRLFVEEPLHEQQGALSVLVGNYQFEQTPPHAELLGRIAKIAAAAGAPFIAAVSSDCLKKKAPEEVHPLIVESWENLRRMPHSRYLGLAVPRFLLRWPYGAKTEPIDPFPFEEFTPQGGLQGMLWGNSAVLAGLLLAETAGHQGLASMKLGSVMSVGDMPFYFYTDEHGDQVALPCTERVVTEQRAAQVTRDGFMPVLAFKGRPEVRLGNFNSLGRDTLAGPWNPLEIAEERGSGACATATHEQLEPPQTVAPQPHERSGRAEESVDDRRPDRDEPPTPARSDDSDDDARSEPDSPALVVAADGGANELDSLLAELEAASAPPTSSDDEMDPELKALLEDL